MFTPIDLQNKELKSGRGYSKKEADVFLQELYQDYETLFRENLELKDKISVLSEGVQYYKSIETTLQKALVLAEKTSKETQEAAVKKAKEIEEQAQAKAVDIEARIQARIEELTSEAAAHAEQVKSEADQHAAKVKSDADEQARRLTEEAFTKANSMTNEAVSRVSQLEQEAQKRAEEYENSAKNRADMLTSEAMNMATNLEKNSQEKSEQMLKKAEKQSQEIIAKAEQESEKQQRQNEILVNQFQNFRMQLQKLATAQLQMLEDSSEIEQFVSNDDDQVVAEQDDEQEQLNYRIPLDYEEFMDELEAEKESEIQKKQQIIEERRARFHASQANQTQADELSNESIETMNSDMEKEDSDNLAKEDGVSDLQKALQELQAAGPNPLDNPSYPNFAPNFTLINDSETKNPLLDDDDDDNDDADNDIPSFSTMSNTDGSVPEDNAPTVEITKEISEEVTEEPEENVVDEIQKSLQYSLQQEIESAMNDTNDSQEQDIETPVEESDSQLEESVVTLASEQSEEAVTTEELVQEDEVVTTEELVQEDEKVENEASISNEDQTESVDSISSEEVVDSEPVQKNPDEPYNDEDDDMLTAMLTQKKVEEPTIEEVTMENWAGVTLQEVAEEQTFAGINTNRALENATDVNDEITDQDVLGNEVISDNETLDHDNELEDLLKELRNDLSRKDGQDESFEFLTDED